MTYAPSKYQQAIYDFVDAGGGDLRVNAVAGSGKTTTLKEIAKRLPLDVRNSSIFVAFNKHIADELKAALPAGVECSTIHSVGFKVIRKALNLPPALKPEGRKMEKIVRGYTQDVRPDSGLPIEADDVEALAKMARFAMMTLTDPKDEEAVLLMCQHYGIEVLEWDYCFRALAVLIEKDVRLAREGVAVSFDDMVYLPVALGMALPKYGFLFVDECQDLNTCQRRFVIGMRGPGGRIVFVGDRSQAIYGFTGADADSFDNIQAETGASELPLSVCYRCPASHIRLARELVPQIEAREGAPDGVTADVRRTQVLSMAKVGDLILCRTTAPLIELCFEFIAAGRNAKVKGRDIGATLIKILDTVEKIRGFDFVNFTKHLSDYHAQMHRALSSREGTEMQIESLNDRVDSIQAIYDARVGTGRLHSLGDMRREIEAIFSDDAAPIMLSTVHKAKGLENERVMLLKEELMPHPMAKMAWERDQEQNIRYVALTRSKNELYFIREDRFEPKKPEATAKADEAAAA